MVAVLPVFSIMQSIKIHPKEGQKMNRLKKMQTKLAGIVLSALLVLNSFIGAIGVRAAETGNSDMTSATSILFIDDVEPSEYDVNDTSNPYGLENGGVFNINPVSELYTYVSYDLNGSGAYNKYTISDKVSLDWRTMNTGTVTTKTNEYDKNWAHAVSFDSDGDGRNESVATVYWKPDYGVGVEITNLVKNTTTRNRRSL